jgi:uncharacterized protein involved in cysteine biosynthesis
MVPAFLLTCSEIFDGRLRRTLFLSVVLALAVLAALALAASYAVARTPLFDSGWLDGAAHLLGTLGVLALTWLLFPLAVSAVLGFFLDGVVADVEQRRYPPRPPARRPPFAENLRAGTRLALLGVAINLVALPLYLLLPGLNVALFYLLNGWLLGREYFELVARRRLGEVQLRALWRAERIRLISGGILIAALLTVPIVNLAAPLFAAVFMLHLFEECSNRRAGRLIMS